MSVEKLENEMTGVETELESNSEDKKKLKKKPGKKEVRMKKVRFEKERKEKDIQEQVDKLTRKLLWLDVKDNMYAIAYMQLFVLVPNLIDKLPPLSQFGINTAIATNAIATPSQPSYL